MNEAQAVAAVYMADNVQLNYKYSANDPKKSQPPHKTDDALRVERFQWRDPAAFAALNYGLDVLSKHLQRSPERYQDARFVHFLFVELLKIAREEDLLGNDALSRRHYDSKEGKIFHALSYLPPIIGSITEHYVFVTEKPGQSHKEKQEHYSSPSFRDHYWRLSTHPHEDISIIESSDVAKEQEARGQDSPPT